MILLILFLIRNATAIAIILASNPLTLSIWVIITAFTISVTFGTSSISWFGLILFIIYIGGMLVIFSYFTAIQPNQHLSIGKIIVISSLSTLALLSLKSKIYKPIIQINYSSTIRPKLLLIPESLPILTILGAVLLLALISVVKISKFNQGPLRPFLYVQPTPKIPPPN